VLAAAGVGDRPCAARGVAELGQTSRVAGVELASAQPTVQRSWPAHLAVAGAEPAVRLAMAGRRKGLGRRRRRR
jgi:allophanate hydrolase subunit 2